MMGTFGGALEARKIDASDVALRLAAPEQVRETVERVHETYAMRCPLYRTLHNAIQLTSSCTLMSPTDPDAAL